METITIEKTGSYQSTSSSDSLNSDKLFIKTELISIIESAGFKHLKTFEDDDNIKCSFSIPEIARYVLIVIRTKSTAGIRMGIASPDDVDNTNYIYADGNGITGLINDYFQEGTRIYYWTYSSSLKLVNVNKNLVCLFTFDTANNAAYIFDTDNFGNKYIEVARTGNVYFDKESEPNGTIFNGTMSTNSLTDTVYIEKAIILQSNKIKGIAGNIYRMQNSAISTGALKLIEADGVQYRQAYNNIWISEE